MRVITFASGDAERLGVMTSDEEFIEVPHGASDLQALLSEEDGLASLKRSVHGREATGRISEVELVPLVRRPNAIWALALNFEAHIAETGLSTSDRYPHLFLRTALSLVGAGQPLLAPPESVARRFDYEGELVVIIGRAGRHIPPEKALDHVAGYAVGNEGSVREYQTHNRQFGLGKNFERSGSYGPWLMTPDEFGDVAKAEVRTRLNGKTRQRSSLSDMRFGVEQVISYISESSTVLPGDLIFMGTPGALPVALEDQSSQAASEKSVAPAAAVAAGHGPLGVPGAVHMRPGDTCEVEISGLGILRNPIIADAAAAYTVGS
jgi:2-keto-4-pentenoate hydratase/2-oxohepta-3-ene-1,7-dioic acid hydratase in catechol pathway